MDLSKKDVKLRNTISPSPDAMEAHTTPRMTNASIWEAATRMKLASDATTHTATRILYRKGEEGEEERGGRTMVMSERENRARV